MYGTFHWRDGWHFWRNENGSVSFEHRIYEIDADGKYTETYTCDLPCVNIDADSWASIVAAVSELGEAAGRWQTALNFHNGQ